MIGQFRIRLHVLGVLMLATSLAGLPVQNARAAPAAPAATLSRYVQSTNLYPMGCSQGQRSDALGLDDAVVILDFGKASSRDSGYGAILFGLGFRTTTQIAEAAKSYLQGFWDCTAMDSTSFVELAIGTSNCTIDPACSGSATGFEHGEAWAQMVQAVNDWIVASGFQSQEVASGANDMEVSCDTPARTRAWTDGYSSVATSVYYDFGDAAGCPWVGTQGAVPRPCNNGWTQEDVRYVAAGTGAAWPIPEIYREDAVQARQWQLISLYSVLSGSGRLLFPAALSQWQACRDVGSPCTTVNNTPSQSWSQLYDTLAADARTAPDPNNTTEFRWASQMSWQTVGAGSLHAHATRAPRAPRALKGTAPLKTPPTTEAWPVGIIDGEGPSPLPAEVFVTHNAWQDLVDGHHVTVYAGSERGDPSQGVLVVFVTSLDLQTHRLGLYRTPARVGALRVVAADAPRLTLVSTSGRLVAFDVASLQFIAP